MAAVGIAWAGRSQTAIAGPTVANAYGNNLPGITGYPDHTARPAPGPGPVGGQQGGTGDGEYGADPRAAKMQPDPHVSILQPGWQETFVRWGTQGFSDKLTVKDRHGYWDTGNQKTGLAFNGAAGPLSGTFNDPQGQPPRPDFRLINRTVSYQIGTDATRNQDDITRPYTWLGEQGSGWSPIYGGVPGLYSPYGSRGGVPFPIVSPAGQGQPGDGPHLVFAGPPHGLHTQTPWMRRGTAQTNARFQSTPQTRPVRQDRPSNSPQAGQSYSQTVMPQGASAVRPAGTPGYPGSGPARGRVWPGGRGFHGNMPGARG
jgi:hypothetical protein